MRWIVLAVGLLAACAHAPVDPCANVKPGDACVRIPNVTMQGGAK